MSAKIQEAEEHCKAAEKHLKTSFLRWKPDLDSAADEYAQAAQCYRIVRDIQRAKDCNLKAAELYQRNNSLFHAAKAIENVIMICKEHTDPHELFLLAERSGKLYSEHGSGDSAATVLSKTAKIVEEYAPEKAIKLYRQAADYSVTESGQHMGAEYIAKATKLLVRHEWYDQAVDSIRQEIGYHTEANNNGAVGRLCVAIVLVQLARGDIVAAQKAFAEWGGYCEQTEVHTLDQMLMAFDEDDRDGARAALAAPFIRHMDIEYSRLALKIPLPEPIEVVRRPEVGEPATMGGGSVETTPHEEPNQESVSNSHQNKESEVAEDEDELC